MRTSLRWLRFGTELRSANLDQAVLCDFIVEGHLGRHIRRMRELYAERLGALLDGGRRHLRGLMEISSVRRGCIRRDSRGMEWVRGRRSLLLGFAAFEGARIREGWVRLARTLEKRGES